jgi:hypothetical protein
MNQEVQRLKQGQELKQIAEVKRTDKKYIEKHLGKDSSELVERAVSTVKNKALEYIRVADSKFEAAQAEAAQFKSEAEAALSRATAAETLVAAAQVRASEAETLVAAAQAQAAAARNEAEMAIKDYTKANKENKDLNEKMIRCKEIERELETTRNSLDNAREALVASQGGVVEVGRRNHRADAPAFRVTSKDAAQVSESEDERRPKNKFRKVLEGLGRITRKRNSRNIEQMITVTKNPITEKRARKNKNTFINFREKPISINESSDEEGEAGNNEENGESNSDESL